MPKGDNAGRPKGSRNRSRSKHLTEAKIARLIEHGRTPLDVKMSRMQWWEREAAILEAKVRAKLPKGASILEVERAGVIKALFEAFDKLQFAADQAAPYVHPRISSIDDPVASAQPDFSALTNAELEQYEKIARKISRSFGDQGGT